ncbi:MAG: zinc metallopeptidase [Patulibacter sp.]|nr:zinc metallopeptidase [Patulibacter sp.]
MTGFALFWLAVFVIAFIAVAVVRTRALRVVRSGSAPEDALPTGEAFARAALGGRGLGVVKVIPADVDAYRAIPRELQLADGRFDHGSAAGCAIAALEVAHAAQHAAGSTPWKRWWVISGHTVWAGPLLPIVSVVELVVDWPPLALVTFACVAVLALSGILSLVVEQTAVATARELLADDSIDRAYAADIDRVLRWAARAYVAESIFDLGFLDRAVEPYRGEPLDAPGSNFGG